MAPTDTALPPVPPEVDESNAQQALRAAALLALEAAAVRALTVPLRRQLVAIQRDATRAWIRAFGGTDRPGDPIRAAAIAADVRGQLARLQLPDAAVLGDYVTRALNLGVVQAARMVPAALPAGVEPAQVTAAAIGAAPDAFTSRIVAALPATLAETIGQAETAVATVDGSSYAQLDGAVARAHRAVPQTARNVITAVNGAANAGKVSLAQWLGADVLWLAEPDCCTTCAGLAGRMATGGLPFDSRFASTFTDKPHLWPTGPLMQPPAHPNCRCELVPWFGDASGGGSGLPEALQREARRAILKGWSLPSESEAERLRAAQKALNQRRATPKSVSAYARRAVDAGHFPTRDVPVHTPRPRTHTTRRPTATPRKGKQQ